MTHVLHLAVRERPLSARNTIGQVESEERSVEREERVRRSAQGDVAVKPSPAAPLEVVEPDLLLEVLVVALDAPAQLREPDEFLEWSIGGEVGEPELGRLLLVGWPLVEKPLLGARSPALRVLVCAFNVGIWFDDPNAAVDCGFNPLNPTPFNGEHKAGPLAMISTPDASTGLGPLCTHPDTSATPARCSP